MHWRTYERKLAAWTEEGRAMAAVVQRGRTRAAPLAAAGQMAPKI
jgi:hypothetical protein